MSIAQLQRLSQLVSSTSPLIRTQFVIRSCREKVLTVQEQVAATSGSYDEDESGYSPHATRLVALKGAVGISPSHR